MSGLLFNSCEWDDWLVKGKLATAMGWSTQEIFGFANEQVFDLKLVIMLFYNGLLSETEETF